MTKTRLRWAAMILVVFTLDVNAASTVRGKVYRQADGRSYAVPGVQVALQPSQGVPKRAYSAADGMFYFYNVAPGTYTLEVIVSKEDVRHFTIRVDEQPYTDIAPIRLR
jgi:hypothetical protein